MSSDTLARSAPQAAPEQPLDAALPILVQLAMQWPALRPAERAVR